ncbi:MAG TPA: hypothetical protein VGV88_07625 [Candidatus Dormibacteraeota bacterium]|nr:hypothetical protein [Candidatus Dormibacteraeota bacterium]
MITRRQFAIAYAMGLAPALALAIWQPVWSRVDEAAHYDVIAQYAAGVYPRDATTTIRPETLEIMQRSGVYGFVVDNEYVRPDPGLQPVPSGLTPDAQVVWIRRHGWEFSYEAFQPPLYYALALPAWFAGHALGGALGSLYAVRIFDALLAALLAPLAMMILVALWPGHRGAAWAAAALTAVLPGVALNLTSVTNDVLVSVLGALCVLVAVTGKWSWRRDLLLGALFGAALLTKTSAVGIAPALAVALLQTRRDGGVRPVLIASATAAGCVIPWLASNLSIYGELVTTREQLAMAAFPPRTADPGFWSVSTLHAFVTFWTGDPFLSLPGAVALAIVAAFITALAAAGLWRAWRRHQKGMSLRVLGVLAAAGAGAALVSVTSPLLAAFNAPGRLAYVAVAAAVALVAAGLWVEVSSPRLRWGTVGTFAGLSLGGLALTVYGGALPPPATAVPTVVRQSPLGQSGTFQNLEVSLVACGVDRSGDLMVLVSFYNTGTEAVEWTQTAELRDGADRVATSDFNRSTPFPLAFAPGHRYDGWLFLGQPRHHLANPTIYFRDLAAAGYSTIGDLSIRTDLC